jgi:hypothetical protein
MDEVCEFIKSYINGNTIDERAIKFIPIKPNEEFSTFDEEKEYIFQHLNTIQDISAIKNIHKGENDTHCADLIIANYMVVKLTIGTELDSHSYEYWDVELEAIMNFN